VIPILLFTLAGCEGKDSGPKISSGAGKQSGWRAHCERELRFLIHYPPEMELRVKSPEVTAQGKFNLLEWRVPRAEWFVVLHVHEPSPATGTHSLSKWLEDWGGNLEETTLDGNVPAVSRTWLFEGIYEKSIFFPGASSHRVVEIRLVVPKIVDWMGSTEKIEPQYRSQEEMFDRMVKSIDVGECP
jgi:hypothetical protein